MLSAANPKVYEVLDDIIREVAMSFRRRRSIWEEMSRYRAKLGEESENLELMRSHGYTSPTN